MSTLIEAGVLAVQLNTFAWTAHYIQHLLFQVSAGDIVHMDCLQGSHWLGHCVVVVCSLHMLVWFWMGLSSSLLLRAQTLAVIHHLCWEHCCKDFNTVPFLLDVLQVINGHFNGQNMPVRHII